jgi:hypothetical protein
MPTPGIKLVWAGWNDDDVIGFSEQGYKRWRASLMTGTRMLVYETTGKRPGSSARGRKAIVGEVEVAGTFEDGEALRAPTEQHARLLPVKIISPRGAGKPIPLERVRQIIEDDKWPRLGETWKPLTERQYRELVAERENA